MIAVGPQTSPFVVRHLTTGGARVQPVLLSILQGLPARDPKATGSYSYPFVVRYRTMNGALLQLVDPSRDWIAAFAAMTT